MKTIIANRRSIYPIQFSGKGLTDSQLHELFEAANWAPTHGYTEPWRFVVYKGEALNRLGQFLATYDQACNKNINFIKKSFL